MTNVIHIYMGRIIAHIMSRMVDLSMARILIPCNEHKNITLYDLHRSLHNDQINIFQYGSYTRLYNDHSDSSVANMALVVDHHVVEPSVRFAW
jgi:hypothetical protein